MFLKIIHWVFWQTHRKIILLIFIKPPQFVLLIVICLAHVVGVMAGKEELVPGVAMVAAVARRAGAAVLCPESLSVGAVVAGAMGTLGHCRGDGSGPKEYVNE